MHDKKVAHKHIHIVLSYTLVVSVTL